MTLYHVRGRLYCRLCVVKCYGRAAEFRDVEVTHPKIECHRCARFGYPAVPPRAKTILGEFKGDGYGGNHVVIDNYGAAHLKGGAKNANDFTRVPYGFTLKDRDDAQKALRAAGIDLSSDQVDALLCVSLVSRQTRPSIRSRT